MESLYLLVPLSIAVVFGAIWLFFHMSDDGQFDDLVSPGWRILQDDDRGGQEIIEHTSSASTAPAHTVTAVAAINK